MSERLKQQAAEAVLDYITPGIVIGVGTGSTVQCFINVLSKIKSKIDACIASSIFTEKALRVLGFNVLELNMVQELSLYIDGADEIQDNGVMIKGGGGALVREKIIATVATEFICIVDESKLVKRLGAFPLAVEVLPIARSYVARELVKLGGDPAYRNNFITDNGNIILDVYNLDILLPIKLEEQIKLIPGVVDSGLFAKRWANRILVATETNGVQNIRV